MADPTNPTEELSPEQVQTILDASEGLELEHASGVISGFHANCNSEVASANGIRYGRSLAVAAFTAPAIAEARKSKAGPATVLSACFRVLGK